jgi:hypothetical protein
MKEPDFDEEVLPPVDFDRGTLRARKAYFDETTQTLSIRTGMSQSTVTAVMRGRNTVRLITLQRLAAQLGLQVQIRFTQLETSSPIGTTAGSDQPEMAKQVGTRGREGKPNPNVQWNASRSHKKH